MVCLGTTSASLGASLFEADIKNIPKTEISDSFGRKTAKQRNLFKFFTEGDPDRGLNRPIYARQTFAYTLFQKFLLDNNLCDGAK